MKFKVCVEQRQVGYVECEVPDEKWEKHADRLYRRKMVKQAANRALADGADVEWLSPEAPEATTVFVALEE